MCFSSVYCFHYDVYCAITLSLKYELMQFLDASMRPNLFHRVLDRSTVCKHFLLFCLRGTGISITQLTCRYMKRSISHSFNCFSLIVSSNRCFQTQVKFSPVQNVEGQCSGTSRTFQCFCFTSFFPSGHQN